MTTHSAKNISTKAEPSSPPAPAGTAREFVIEWAKQHKETYLQVDDIADCAEAYAAERERQAVDKECQENGRMYGGN